MNEPEEKSYSNIDTVKKYQIDRAYEYVQEHTSRDGSEDSLEVCIISDLLKLLKGDLK